MEQRPLQRGPTGQLRRPIIKPRMKTVTPEAVYDPVETVFTIEVSKLLDTTGSPDNNTFGATLNRPIIIEDGDYLDYRLALINTGTPATGLITLTDDVPVTMSYGYYDGGAYACDDLEETHTSNETATAYTKWGGIYNDNLNLPIDGQIFGFDGEDIANEPFPFANLCLKPDGTTPFLFYDFPDEDVPVPIVTTTSFTVPAGYYQPEALAAVMTRNIQAIPPINDSETNYSTNFLLTTGSGTPYPSVIAVKPGQSIGPTPASYLESDNPYVNQAFRFIAGDTDASYSLDPLINIGATQLAIDYNGQFQITAMHAPVFDNTGSAPVMTVKLQKNGWFEGTYNEKTGPVTLWSTVNRSGGIFLTDVQPTSFWNTIMGFNLDTLLIPEYATSDSAALDPDRFAIGTATTANFISYQAFQPNGYRYNVNDQLSTYVESTESIPIVANQSTYNGDQGYFDIEINTQITTPQFTDGSRQYPIIGVVSKQWNNNNMVTSYGTDSVPVVHRGPPMVLSSIVIRILDGDTKLPATGLDPRSVVFVTVHKQNSLV